MVAILEDYVGKLVRVKTTMISSKEERIQMNGSPHLRGYNERMLPLLEEYRFITYIGRLTSFDEKDIGLFPSFEVGHDQDKTYVSWIKTIEKEKDQNIGTGGKTRKAVLNREYIFSIEGLVD